MMMMMMMMTSQKMHQHHRHYHRIFHRHHYEPGFENAAATAPSISLACNSTGGAAAPSASARQLHNANVYNRNAVGKN
jgi:hypothetical protein